MSNVIGKFICSGKVVVFYAWMYAGSESSEFTSLQHALSDRCAVFLMWIPWCAEDRQISSLESSNKALSLALWVNKRKESYPNHRYIFMCNTWIERYQLRMVGLEAEVFNQNSFIDPQVYRPIECTKQFLAVYNAQIVPFKRYELLTDTPNVISLAHRADYEYFVSTWPLIKENVELKNPYSVDHEKCSVNVSGLSWHDINHFINSSKVGLALSDGEGAMHAAVEYLLAGIPVVSTYNYGGRDMLMDARFCAFVEATPMAISIATESLASADFDPLFIRSETIRKQRIEINRFLKFSFCLAGRDFSQVDLVGYWDLIFYNKLHKSQSIENHIQDLYLIENELGVG